MLGEWRSFIIAIKVIRLALMWFLFLAKNIKTFQTVQPTDPSEEWRGWYNANLEYKPFQNLDLIGFGNCYLNSYSLSASIGNFVQCNLSYACSNLSFDIYDYDTVPPSPAVNGEGIRSTSSVDLPEDQIRDEVEDPNEAQSILVLRPGDLEVILTNNKPNSSGGFNLIDLNASGMAVQSVDVAVNIERKDINGFGSNYIKDRKMQFPILCQLSMSVLARQFESKEYREYF